MKALSTLPRLFLEGAPLARAGAAVTIPLQPPAAHYLSTVLRLRPGDALRVFDGASGEWLAEVAGATSGGKRGGSATALRLRVQLRAQHDAAAPPPACTPWLLYAPLRPGRMQALVEKAVELGADALVPVGSARGQHVESDMLSGATAAVSASDDPLTRAVVAAHAATGRALRGGVRPDKLRAWAVEAAEQSERLGVPSLPPPVRLDWALSAWAGLQPARAAVAPIGVAGDTAAAAAAEHAAAKAALTTVLDYGGTADSGAATLVPARHRLLVVCDEALAPVRAAVANNGASGAPAAGGALSATAPSGASPPPPPPPSVYAAVRAWRATLPPSAPLQPPPLVALLVGPEGGWTDTERAECDVYASAAVTTAAAAACADKAAASATQPVQQQQQCAIVRASLGGWAGVLRAETAAAAALALAQQAAADGAVDAAETAAAIRRDSETPLA